MLEGKVDELLAGSQVGDTGVRARCANGDTLVKTVSASSTAVEARRPDTRGTRGWDMLVTSSVEKGGCPACLARNVAKRRRHRRQAFILHFQGALELFSVSKSQCLATLL